MIEEDEKEFIDKDGDLIPIFERRKSLMRQAIERLLWGKLSSLFGVKEPGRQDRVDSEYVGYFSNQGFDIVMTFVVVVFGLGFLLGEVFMTGSLSTTRLIFIYQDQSGGSTLFTTMKND